jgi:hypothetical protein
MPSRPLRTRVAAPNRPGRPLKSSHAPTPQHTSSTDGRPAPPAGVTSRNHGACIACSSEGRTSRPPEPANAVIDSADTMWPASGSTTNERCTVLSDPDRARRAHPLLQTWRTRLHHQNTRSSIDQLLLARITWALTVAHLTPDSYRNAADRAVASALVQTAGRPIVEIDVACADPALLPTAATPAPGSATITCSYLDQDPTPWPSTDIDLVEVTVTTDDPTADTLIGRGWAAPDWLSTGQVRFYDLLRADRMTPAQALARVRRLPGRSVQAGHARRRTAHRRIRL